MKKLFLLLMLLPFLSNAQYFNLTENGFVPAIGDNAKFIVIDKAGQTQEELFNQVKSYITASYVSPKDVLSENGTEMITLRRFGWRCAMQKRICNAPIQDKLYDCLPF